MATPDKPSAAAHALEAAHHGWRLIPLRTGEKRPAWRGWQTRATSDTTTVAGWWQTTSAPNYGIHLGGSGLLVIDVDGAEGRESLNAAEAQLGGLPESLRVETPRGLHVYLHDPGGITRRLGWRPGLDVLAGTAYAVGTGSVVDERAYRLMDSDTVDPARIGTLPASWAAALLPADSLPTRDHMHPIPPTPNGEAGRAGGADAPGGDDAAGKTGRDGGPGFAGSDDDPGDHGASGVQEVFDRYPLEKHGTSHRLIFTLARHTRSLFVDVNRPPPEVTDALRRWWEAGQHNTQRTWADTLADFTDAWERIRFDRGGLAEALNAAEATGCDSVVAGILPDPSDAPARLLAALAAELSRRANGAAFYLAQAEAGLVLGVPRDRVGRWLRLFRRMGWLELVESGSYAERRASTYRWLLAQHFTAGAGAQPHDPA